MKFKIVQTRQSGEGQGSLWSWWMNNADTVARLIEQPAVYQIEIIEEWNDGQKLRTWLPATGWQTECS